MTQQVGKIALPQRQEALLMCQPYEAVEEGVARDSAIPDQLVCVLCLKHHLQATDTGPVAHAAAGKTYNRLRHQRRVQVGLEITGRIIILEQADNVSQQRSAIPSHDETGTSLWRML